MSQLGGIGSVIFVSGTPHTGEDDYAPILSGRWLTETFPLPRGFFLAPSVVNGGTAYPACCLCWQPIVSVERVLSISMSGVGHYYHLHCAGAAQPDGRIGTREDWIREGSPFVSGTPCYLLADWSEEVGRNKDADWLREFRSGQ